MKTITNTFNIYYYDELGEEAKEKVKQWCLDDTCRNDLFSEDIKNYLFKKFPSSALNYQYSLSYRQGDGFNIYGSVNPYDFIDKWESSEKEKRAIKFYLQYAGDVTLTKNNSYCYSCKFIDQISDEWIDDTIQELRYNCIKNINHDLIEKFYFDLIDHFDTLDANYKADGYNFFYNVDDEEVEDFCINNEFYFLSDGSFYGSFCE